MVDRKSVIPCMCVWILFYTGLNWQYFERQIFYKKWWVVCFHVNALKLKRLIISAVDVVFVSSMFKRLDFNCLCNASESHPACVSVWCWYIIDAWFWQKCRVSLSYLQRAAQPAVPCWSFFSVSLWSTLPPPFLWFSISFPSPLAPPPITACADDSTSLPPPSSPPAPPSQLLSAVSSLRQTASIHEKRDVGWFFSDPVTLLPTHSHHRCCRSWRNVFQSAASDSFSLSGFLAVLFFILTTLLDVSSGFFLLSSLLQKSDLSEEHESEPLWVTCWYPILFFHIFERM